MPSNVRAQHLKRSVLRLVSSPNFCDASRPRRRVNRLWYQANHATARVRSLLGRSVSLPTWLSDSEAGNAFKPRRRYLSLKVL